MSTSDPFDISPAREDELPTIVALALAVERQHEAYWKLRWQMRPGREDGWLRWLTRRLHDDDMLILAARERRTDGTTEPVGALLAVIEKEMPVYAYDRYAFIHDVAVRDDRQGRGLGTRMLQASVAWARARGVNQIRLLAAEQNPRARALFAKVGFRVTYHEMVLPTE